MEQIHASPFPPNNNKPKVQVPAPTQVIGVIYRVDYRRWQQEKGALVLSEPLHRFVVASTEFSACAKLKNFLNYDIEISASELVSFDVLL
jgi:hypothetical protein